MGNIFSSKSLKFNLPLKQWWHSYKKPFSWYCTEVDFKANPGTWVQKKKVHSPNSLSKCCKSTSTWTTKWRNLWHSPVDVSFTVVLMAATSGRSPTSTGKAKSRKTLRFSSSLTSNGYRLILIMSHVAV